LNLKNVKCLPEANKPRGLNNTALVGIVQVSWEIVKFEAMHVVT
jgi:hypothetical protein